MAGQKLKKYENDKYSELWERTVERMKAKEIKLRSNKRSNAGST